MKEQTILGVVTDFLNQLEVSDKKVLNYDVSIRRSISDHALLEMNLCEHAVGTKISVRCDNVDGCSFCKEEPVLEKERKREKNIVRSIKRIKGMPMEDRISVVRNELPELFSMNDFIDNLKEKGYSYKVSRSMWKGTIEALRGGHKIKKIQDGEENKTKYRLIKESEEPGDFEEEEIDTTLHGKYADKVNKFINYRFERKRDFSTVELAEYLGIEHKIAGQIIYKLKKRGFITRSNPEIKDKQKYRYVKTEKELVEDIKEKEKENEEKEVDMTLTL